MNFKKTSVLLLFISLFYTFAYAETSSPCIDGITISTDDGQDAILLSCEGDGTDGIFKFVTSRTAMPFAFVVIDENDIILAIGLQSEFNLNDFEGNLRVYAFSFLGPILADIGDNLFSTNLAAYCFELTDNYVSITRENLQGGTVQLDNGETEAAVCVNDGVEDILHFNNLNAMGGANYVYIISDEAGNILSIVTDDTQDFDGAPAGICQVWGLVYDGNLLAEVGDNINTATFSDVCFGLSENFITVNRKEVQAGTITFSDNGENFFELCSNSNQTEVGISVTGNVGDHYAYVITDISGGIETVLNISETYLPQITFSNTRHIYGIAYSGDVFTATEIQNLVTQNISDAVFRDNCYDLASDPIELQVSVVDGGGIQLEDGTTAAFICSNDIVNGIISFQNTSTSNESQTFVLTNEDNTIVTFISGNTVNLTIAAPGNYKIWSVSYTGNLIAQINDSLMDSAISDGCYDISNNSISISKTDVEGGSISLENGDTELILCPDGGDSSVVPFLHTGAIGQFQTYIVTDSEGIILSNFDDEFFDFSTSFFVGKLHFWGLSYSGTFNLPIGEQISTAVFTDDCYDLTDNYVQIIYEIAQAGIISGMDGLTDITVCVGDGTPDVVNFIVEDASHLNYVYLVTDTAGFLTGVLMDDSFDFDNAVGGDCRIYGLSYSGDLIAISGDNIFDFPLSNDCWDITDNFITLSKTAVDGGILFTDIPEDIIYVCAGDGIDDIIQFSNSSSANEANYKYVLTSENNIILSVLDDNESNFEDSGFEIFHVWGISYTGNFTGSFGDVITDAVLADGCYILSDNFLTIAQDLPDGGQVSTLDGEVNLQLCIGAESGIIEMSTTSTSVSGYVYLVLDDEGKIVDVYPNNFVDFNTIDTGIYRIWGLSYTGVLLAAPGQFAITANLASSCFGLSENFVEVIREATVDGGIISLLGTDETTVYTCPNDDVADLYIFESNSTDENLLYVITDTFNNIIVPQIVSPVIDFDAADSGIYRVYGISLNGNSSIFFGVNVLEDELSDNCYTVSDNYITVVVEAPEGGTVSSDQGTDVTITVGDGIADVLTFNAENASNTPYIYIITDESDEIIGFVDGNTHDFEDAPAGTCRVWGLAYTGSITAQVGDILTEVSISDDCYSLSENYVTLIRTIDGFVGDETIFLNLSIYPNPASSQFVANIEISKQAAHYSDIFIVNTNGQKVQQLKVATVKGSNRIEVDIQGLLPGLYTFIVRNEKVQSSVRFLKQ